MGNTLAEQGRIVLPSETRVSGKVPQRTRGLRRVWESDQRLEGQKRAPWGSHRGQEALRMPQHIRGLVSIRGKGRVSP